MKRIISLALVLACVAGIAYGQASLSSFRQDSNFLTGGRMFCILWVNPAAADTDAVHSRFQCDSVLTSTYTFSDAESVLPGTGSVLPGGMARTVDFTLEGVGGSINTGTITLYGYNIKNEAITEEYATTATTEETISGTKAFNKITYATFPAMDTHGVYASIGLGPKLGLHHTLPLNGLLGAWNGSSADGSALLTVDYDEIEKNVIIYNVAPTGTSDHSVLYWVPPFAVTTSTGKR
jgi:hypothetical protein